MSSQVPSRFYRGCSSSLLLVQNHGPNRPGKSDTPISYRLSVINLDCLPRLKHVNNITDLQSRDVTPAAIAGVVRSVLWVRMKL